jgi:hypothetical protein
MISFEQPILLYSNYCEHSNNFILALRKNTELHSNFQIVNIDVDTKTNKRPAIVYDIQNTLQLSLKEVPTIIVENGEYMLSGAEAFKWLDYTLQKLEKQELQPYCNLEMGSFSDMYSQYGSSEMYDATDQTYAFINRNYENINTPKDDNTSVKEDDFERKQMERESFNNVPRENNIQKKINFSMNTFEPTSLKPVNESKTNTKQKELDLRYNKLISERDAVFPESKKEMPKNIDFQSGKMY